MKSLLAGLPPAANVVVTHIRSDRKKIPSMFRLVSLSMVYTKVCNYVKCMLLYVRFMLGVCYVSVMYVLGLWQVYVMSKLCLCYTMMVSIFLYFWTPDP